MNFTHRDPDWYLYQTYFRARLDRPFSGSYSNFSEKDAPRLKKEMNRLATSGPWNAIHQGVQLEDNFRSEFPFELKRMFLMSWFRNRWILFLLPKSFAILFHFLRTDQEGDRVVLRFQDGRPTNCYRLLIESEFDTISSKRWVENTEQAATLVCEVHERDWKDWVNGAHLPAQSILQAVYSGRLMLTPNSFRFKVMLLLLRFPIFNA